MEPSRAELRTDVLISSPAASLAPVPNNGQSLKKVKNITIAVEIPTNRIECIALSIPPSFDVSPAMSISLIFASKPGKGNGSSTNHTLLKIMKYKQPRNPPNMEATIATPAKAHESGKSKDESINCSPFISYFGE